jgi:hypothetical protein
MGSTFLTTMVSARGSKNVNQKSNKLAFGFAYPVLIDIINLAPENALSK